MYDGYSEFDVEKHKATYIDYLEVIIDKDGKVMYAVPSHQGKLELLAAEMNKCSVTEIQNMCPPEMYFDYLSWLIELTNTVVVWTKFEQHCSNVTSKQRNTLRHLKMCGVYKGPIIRPASHK